MSDNLQELDILRDLLGQADSVGVLANTAGVFDAAFKAFRAEDPKAFAGALAKAQLTIHCERICHWIRTKECVFLCFELAGPPVAVDRQPDPAVLAKALQRLSDDDAMLKKLADALVKRDAKGFNAIAGKLGLGAHLHFFCHWLCVVRYRLVCRWICHWQRIPRPVLWEEIRDAARAVGALAAKVDMFKAAVAASSAGDAAKLSAAIKGAGLEPRCHWICEFFCSWRCVWACLLLNRQIAFKPVEAAAQSREASAFAQALARLSQSPDHVMQLSAAVGAGDAQRWAALLKQFQLEPFAFQLCHWICGWRCWRFCFLVCPPVGYHPWFTHIGDFSITGDVDVATGLTKWARGGHGGPNFGFFANLSLRGFCPKHDPAHPAEEMAYRFLFQPAGGVATPITGGFVAEVLVGTRYAMWKGNPNTLQTIRIRGTGTTSPTPPTPTPNPADPVPDHYIVPDANGWVMVDQDALDDAFSGYLMGFESDVAVAGGTATTGVAAGTAVPVADQKGGTDCAIIFQATRVGTIAAVNTGSAPDYTNQIGKVRIDNWSEVSLLNLLQFHTGGGTPCTGLSSALDIEYTVDHELIADWSIGMSTASGATLTSPPHAPGTARGGAGTYHENISSWKPCSYTITLNTRRRLTNGLLDDPTKTNSLTFCIGAK